MDHNTRRVAAVALGLVAATTIPGGAYFAYAGLLLEDDPVFRLILLAAAYVALRDGLWAASTVRSLLRRRTA